MTVTADALADLRFGLRFAAKRFRSYAEQIDLPDNAGLFRELASERNEDAESLDHIAEEIGLDDGRPTIDVDNAGTALGEPDRVYRRRLSSSFCGDLSRALCAVEVPFCCCG